MAGRSSRWGLHDLGDDAVRIDRMAEEAAAAVAVVVVAVAAVAAVDWRQTTCVTNTVGRVRIVLVFWVFFSKNLVAVDKE